MKTMQMNVLTLVIIMLLTATFGLSVVQAEKDIPSRLSGIDISHYQGSVSWEQIKEHDIKFVYIKATQGEYYVDKMFEQHRERAKQSGVLYGYYHFFDPDADATTQAEHFIKTIGSVKGCLPAVIDVEVLGKQSGKDLVQKVRVWLGMVKKEFGIEPIIYSDLHFFKEHLEPSFISPHRLWVADYRKGYQFKQDHDLVFAQYSQKGQEKGIHGTVDLDWFEGTPKELEQLLYK